MTAFSCSVSFATYGIATDRSRKGHCYTCSAVGGILAEARGGLNRRPTRLEDVGRLLMGIAEDSRLTILCELWCYFRLHRQLSC
jgi:hypothetical protein